MGGIKYLSKMFCRRCDMWVRDDDVVVSCGRLFHSVCGKMVRTRPRKTRDRIRFMKAVGGWRYEVL
jgi:late competence protein required for DNA uptake (superfamily II DNA/RNA helicase)